MPASLMKTYKDQILDGFDTESTGLLDGAKLKLAQGVVAQSDTVVLADLTEATFSGYAEVTLDVAGESHAGPDGRRRIVYPSVQFTHSGGGTANTVTGWYITNAAEDALIMYRLLPEAKDMTTNDDALIVTPEYRFGD